MIRVLSAGAPKAGVRRCLEAFQEATGQGCEIEFATAPVIEARIMAGGSLLDPVIAPLPKLQAFAEANRIAAEPLLTIGSIAAGVAVGDQTPDPDLSSVETFVAAIRDADGLVYNRASSGAYIATLIEDLGLSETVAAKTVRVATGPAVMAHLADRVDHVIGFGQTTEILLHNHLGVRLVGPLPPPLGKTTTYAAGLSAEAAGRGAAARLLAFMGAADGRRGSDAC